jgi:hypothetical protein
MEKIIQFQSCDYRMNTADVLPPHAVTLIRERQRRPAAIPRYDRYIAQAAGHFHLQAFWRSLERQEIEEAGRLKNWLDQEVANRA